MLFCVLRSGAIFTFYHPPVVCRFFFYDSALKKREIDFAFVRVLKKKIRELSLDTPG